MDKMDYKIDWIFPKLRKPYRFCWTLASSITVVAVGIFSKIFLEWLNTTKVYNRDVISRAIQQRPRNIPLITVSNHHSCFDDPGLWASLEWRHLLNRKKIRWSLAAHDICFTNTIHSYFFMLGKCVPVVRGKGVHQDALDFCIEKLSNGEWVHVFPEGRVNMTKEFIRFKWGVGRMVYESPTVPIIVPMWHEGTDTVLPNEPPYFLRVGKRVTLMYGEPIDLSSLVCELKNKKATDIEARKAITDVIQDELMKLKEQAEKLHLKS